MRGIMGFMRRTLAGALMLAAVACGGGDPPGSGSSGGGSVITASNVVPVTVDGGPTATSPSVNTLYTTITLCVPGSTTQCQTINNVQVDTGSYGLRVLASVLTLSLPLTAASDGNTLVECTQFVDGYSWGPLAAADVQISGEAAKSVPIQVIGSANFANVPADCSSAVPNSEDTVATFGANGIIGIGVFAQDCGSTCAAPNTNNGFYYSCTQTDACNPIAASLASQVTNPVTLFATDNNGSIIELPSVASTGAASLTGSLIFGIDTETNNASGSQTVLTLDVNGYFTTVFAGSQLTESFIDSGTNGIFFADTNIPACTSSGFSGFYCPATTQNLSATLTGASGVSTTVSFSIDNAQTIGTDHPTYAVLPTLGGSYSGGTPTFDWGLPFFYGRRVANAIENHSTSVGAGPYTAF